MESIKNLAIDTAESSAAFKRRFMWRLLAVLIGGMLLDGYILGIIGPVTGPMKEELGMSTWEMGLVASMALFGILIGSPLGGWAGDKWGRKPLFMIDMALFVVGSILQFFVGSFEMLLVVRLLMGIAIGAEYSVGWPLMSEFAPKELRGRLMATTVLAWYGGIHDRLHGRLRPGAAGGAVADRPRIEHDHRGGLVDRPNRPARVAALVVDRAPLRRGPRHRPQVLGGRRRDDRRRARGHPHRRLRDAVLPAVLADDGLRVVVLVLQRAALFRDRDVRRRCVEEVRPRPAGSPVVWDCRWSRWPGSPSRWR